MEFIPIEDVGEFIPLDEGTFIPIKEEHPISGVPEDVQAYGQAIKQGITPTQKELTPKLVGGKTILTKPKPPTTGIDYLKSTVGGAVGAVGSTISGTGTLYGVAERAIERGAEKVLPESVIAALKAPLIPNWATPQGIFKNAGDTIKDMSEVFRPEMPTLGTDIAQGVGQLGGQMAMYVATGGAAGLVTLLAQGADQMEERLRKSNVPQANKDTAILLGSAITGITEKYGLDLILKRVPPAIRNRVIKNIIDIGAAGGIEASQEFTEGLLHNVTQNLLTELKVPLTKGLGYEAFVAGGSAGIVRAILRSVTGLKMPPTEPTLPQVERKVVIDTNGHPTIPSDAIIEGRTLNAIQTEIAHGNKDILPIVQKAIEEYGEDATADALLNRPVTIAQQDNTLDAWKSIAPEVEKLIRGEWGFIPLEGKPEIKPLPYAYTKSEIEERWAQAHGVKPKPFTTVLKDIVMHILNQTKDFEHLPRHSKRYAQLKFDLLKMSKQMGIAAKYTRENIESIVKDLGSVNYDLFSRKLFLDDLAESLSLDPTTRLPFGFTEETLTIEKSRIDKFVESNKIVQDAIIKRKEIWDKLRKDYMDSASELGIDLSEKLNRENYIRHQILDYVNVKGLFGMGKKYKAPVHRGFLQKRTGSELDINSAYIEAEYEVMAQMMYDIEKFKMLSTVQQQHDISKEVRQTYKSAIEDSFVKEMGEHALADIKKSLATKELSPSSYLSLLKKTLEEKSPGYLKKNGLDTWKNFIPEDYQILQFREGNTFFFAYTVPEQIAEILQSDAFESLEIDKEDITKILAKGGKFKELVVPTPVYDTLNDVGNVKNLTPLNKMSKSIIGHSKIYLLQSPRRYIKWMTRNLTGDMDFVFVGNPRTFLKAKQAYKELYEVLFLKKPMSPLLTEVFNRGLLGSTFQALELGELKTTEELSKLYEKSKSSPLQLPIKVWKGYWNKTRLYADLRESVLRYAAFMDYVEQMQRNPDGLPDNYGASVSEEIKGLSNIFDRAYWLQNSLLGAYDRTSIAGQKLSSSPVGFWFWRWKETNMERYIQVIKNAINDGELTHSVGKKILIKHALYNSPVVAMRVGKLALKMSAIWTLLQTFNTLFFFDEDKDLPDEERKRPHITLGRDVDGNARALTRIGALGDILGNFGLDALPGDVVDWLDGKKSMMDVLLNTAKAPVNTFVQGLSPILKVPVELVVTGRALFPDMFAPRTILNKNLHIAQALGLEEEYKAIFNLPSEGYAKSFGKVFLYEYDPMRTAYDNMKDIKLDYLKKIGKSREGYMLSSRSYALYNLRLSLRYKDREGAIKAYNDYINLGGTNKGITQSLLNLHPLAGLNIKEKRDFKESLSDEDLIRLERAEQFYEETLSPRVYRQFKKELK